jgi:hypothetical protein
VFAGDGQLVSQWGGVLEAADVPSTLIAGVHRSVDKTLRLQEYSPRFDPERFAAHERFFVEDVRRWTRSRFGTAVPAGRTAVLEVSDGGAGAHCSSTRTRLGAVALREAGADLVMIERVGSHGAAFWQLEFP